MNHRRLAGNRMVLCDPSRAEVLLLPAGYPALHTGLLL